MQAHLTYIGRILALEPAELGARFENEATVETHEQAMVVKADWQMPDGTIIRKGARLTRQQIAQLDTAGVKSWRVAERSEVTDQHRNWWYDIHPQTGRRMFYCLSGYGPRIARELAESGIVVREFDLMPCGLPAPDFSRLGDVQFRGSQAQVLAAMLAVRCGVVKCPTGWGKSFILRVMTRLYPDSRIILTVASTDVAREIYEAVKGFDPDIGFVGDGKRDPRRVTVAVSHSLQHCDQNAELLIGDEAHMLMAQRFRELLIQFKRAKFLALTATPEGRGDGGDGFLEALFGPLVADVPFSEAVESGNIVPIRVWMMRVITGPNVAGIENKVRKDRAGIWGNQTRNQRVVDAVRLARAEYGQDAQILVMVDKTEHAFRLQQLLTDFTLVTGDVDAADVEEFRRVGVMQPWQMPCLKKDRQRSKQAFSAGTLKCAIATGVWSRGVNFPDLQVLIRADGQASRINSTQVPGRLTRHNADRTKDHGLLIDFTDQFSPDLKRRAQTRAREYRQHGWTITPVD